MLEFLSIKPTVQFDLSLIGNRRELTNNDVAVSFRLVRGASNHDARIFSDAGLRRPRYGILKRKSILAVAIRLSTIAGMDWSRAQQKYAEHKRFSRSGHSRLPSCRYLNRKEKTMLLITACQALAAARNRPR